MKQRQIIISIIVILLLAVGLLALRLLTPLNNDINKQVAEIQNSHESDLDEKRNHEVTTEVIYVQNGNNRIYGEMFKPEGDGPFPLRDLLP